MLQPIGSHLPGLVRAGKCDFLIYLLLVASRTTHPTGFLPVTVFPDWPHLFLNIECWMPWLHRFSFSLGSLLWFHGFKYHLTTGHFQGTSSSIFPLHFKSVYLKCISLSDISAWRTIRHCQGSIPKAKFLLKLFSKNLLHSQHSLSQSMPTKVVCPFLLAKLGVILDYSFFFHISLGRLCIHDISGIYFWTPPQPIHWSWHHYLLPGWCSNLHLAPDSIFAP